MWARWNILFQIRKTLFILNNEKSDDKETIKALSIIDLPKYVHLIKVPFSLPRTKPKAMNYATVYIKGEYLCVYDAEDKPDSDQLLKALIY